MILGILYALSAYVLWGIFPLYFHSLQAVGAVEIITHRIVWSAVFSLLILICVKRTQILKAALKEPKTVLVFALGSIFVVINWGSYVYAVVSDRTLEASLGYFIGPLLAVFIGALVFKEKLFFFQKISVGLAALALVWLTVKSGTFPVLGVTIALSWTLYGYIRKIAPLGSLEGFVLQSLILTPFALALMAYFQQKGVFYFASCDLSTKFWLMLAGPVTTIPLLLFVAGIRLAPFSVIGMMQYVNPTIVFLLGVFCFNEPVTFVQLIGYAMIWTAAFIFAADGIYRSRKAQSAGKEVKLSQKS